jgi:hypothetical protein
VGPRTPLQRHVAERWCRILDLDRVGLHDRFFELGGTSLDAARFVNQVQTELGETIFVVTLFGAPSVAEYAALLERQFPAAVARLVGKNDRGARVHVPTVAKTPPDRFGDATSDQVTRLRSPRSLELLTGQLDRRRAVHQRERS